jgi:heme exporter protein B
VTGAVAALLRKELRLEWRTREAVPAMALFSVTAFVVFHFGLQRDTLDGQLAAGVLWVTLLLAALLGANRLFVADAEGGALEGVLLAPIDRTALLVAKAIAFAAFLAIVELVAVPAFYLLLLGPSGGDAIPGLLAVLALADVGIAVAGTLVAGLATQTRARDLMVPLLGLPLLLPVVIGAARATAPLFATAGAGALPGRWVAVLGLYDLIFGLIAFAVFDFLLED